MGGIAVKFADRVYVTDDNPRSETPAAIRKEILAAAPGAVEIGDRAEAIAAAVGALAPGDVLGSGTVGTGCLLELTRGKGPWLQPGDTVEMEIERLGTIRNQVM